MSWFGYLFIWKFYIWRNCFQSDFSEFSFEYWGVDFSYNFCFLDGNYGGKIFLLNL